MKILRILAVLMLGVSCQTVEIEPLPKEFVVTNKTIQIVGNIDAASLMAPAKQLAESKQDAVVPIYLYSFTGDFRVVPEFLKLMKNRKTLCFADLASGPAFAILQACGTRLLSVDSAVGPTRPKMMVYGTSDYLLEWSQKVDQMDVEIMQQEADRIGVSREELDRQADALKELVTADQAVKDHHADGVVELKCDLASHSEKLVRTYLVDENKTASVSFTACPEDRRAMDGAPQDLYNFLGIPIVNPQDTQL